MADLFGVQDYHRLGGFDEAALAEAGVWYPGGQWHDIEIGGGDTSEESNQAQPDVGGGGAQTEAVSTGAAPNTNAGETTLQPTPGAGPSLGGTPASPGTPTTPGGTPITPAAPGQYPGITPGVTIGAGTNPVLGQNLIRGLSAFPVIGPVLSAFSTAVSRGLFGGPNTNFGVDPSLQVGGQSGVSAEANTGPANQIDPAALSPDSTAIAADTGATGGTATGSTSTDPFQALANIISSLANPGAAASGGGGGGTGTDNSATPYALTSSGGGSNLLPWLMILAAVGFGGYYWWTHRKKASPAGGS